MPPGQRRNLRDIAANIKCSKSKVALLVKSGALNRIRVNIKPMLTPRHKNLRTTFINQFVDTWGIYSPMYDRVHIDEKWFYLLADGGARYAPDGDDAEFVCCTHKNHIPKVMFLCAVARPRKFADGTKWDGKIGVWPFADWQQAKRSSKNRAAGTPELKPYSVNRDKIRGMILQQLIPAIHKKWPAADTNKAIVIQQDNASPHLLANDPEFLASGAGKELTLSLHNQPAQSPDLNVLDLGIFAALQAEQRKSNPRDLGGLVDVVTDAFDNLSADTIERVFVTLTACMNATLENGGGNFYKLPHLKKAKLPRDELGNIKPIAATIIDVAADNDQNNESGDDGGDDASTASVTVVHNNVMIDISY